MKGMKILEHYSRDKVILRIANTVFFILLTAAMIKYSFFSGEKSFIKYLDFNYYMSPYKAIYLIGVVFMIAMSTFVMAQVDSSSHGIKKKVIEEYSFFIVMSFILMIGHLYFFINRSFKIATMFIFISFLINVVIYIKSQLMKKYMYNDEIRVFVYPFSVSLFWSIMVNTMSFNVMINNNMVKHTSKLFIVFGILELLYLLLACIPALIFFKDRIVSFFTILYLALLCVNTYFNKYFMPIGYLCFLSIILIVVFWFKAFNNKK